MNDDLDPDLVADEAGEQSYFDPIAQRADAYRLLLKDVADLKPHNKALRDEGLAMLKKLRTSFKSHPQGDLVALKGGKS